MGGMGIDLHVDSQSRLLAVMIEFRPLYRSSCLAAFACIVLAGCGGGSPEARYLSRGQQFVAKKDYARALLEFKNASRVQPKSAEPFYQAALAYLAMGDYRTAYMSLIHATELDPKHAAAQTKLAEVIGSSVASTRDPLALEEAEQRVQSALAIVPGNADALGALGLTEYLLGKPDDAAKHLEAALEKFPQHLESARTLAVIKLNQKDFAGAEAVLQKVVQQSPKSAEAEVALARFYLLTGRVADAEAAYRGALAIDSKYGPALLDLARIQLNTGHKVEAEVLLVTLSTLPDKQYRPLHAIYLFEQGKQDDAIKEFEQQFKANPNDRDAFERLASAYFFTKRFPETENLVNAALKKNPKNSDALLERSRLYIITAKFAEAKADLNNVLKFQPDSATAHYLLSKVFQSQGDQRGRRSQLDEALRLNPNLLGARLELAQAFTAMRASKSALDIVNQTPQAQRDSLPVIVERNWALLGTGDRAALRAGIDHGLTRYKSSSELMLQDGLLRLENKDFPGARKSLEQVLASKPQDIRAVDALAKTYIIQKQPAVAMQTVQHYVSQSPNSAPLQNLYGQWLAANQRFDEARKAFRAAIAADPSFEAARVAMGYVELADGKLDAARQAFTSVPQTPGTTVMCELGLAQVEERTGTPAAAIPHYRKVLETEPSNIPALNGLAYQLANETTQIDEALKYAQQAMELAPRSVFVEDTLGWALYRKGMYPSAVEHLRNAAEANGLAVSKYHLAMAYFKMGNTQQGRLLLQQAKLADPNLPEAAIALKVMAEASAKN
jgi:Tfp pilus assembly protein PilF